MSHPLSTRSRRAGLTAALVMSLSLGLAGACTKVVEPPVLEPAPPAPEPVKKVKAPPPRPAWPSSRPSTPPPPPVEKPAEPAVETLNGDPQGLKREDLQNVLDAAMDRFSACIDAPGNTRVALSFDASPTGGAQNVKVSGGGAPAEKCVAGVVAGLDLPRFSGQPVPVHFPITVQRTITQPAPAATPPPESQQRAGRLTSPPMMFVNP